MPVKENQNRNDLKAGINKFCQTHPETDYIYDIKHKTALLLKSELHTDPLWTQFISSSASTEFEYLCKLYYALTLVNGNA